MTSSTPSLHHLEITLAHHGDNEFYMLGRIMPETGGGVLSWNAEVVRDVTHEVPPAALFGAINDHPCERAPDGKSTCAEFCIVLDACTENGDVFDDKEIDVETADRLLDGEFVARLASARGNLVEHYAYEQQRPDSVCMTDWYLALAAAKAPGPEVDHG